MEHEITGHTRKAYKIWRNPDMSLWKKTKEIGVEILIIVFAVSLAAFLERTREHSNEQKVVKDFLLGLKTDLKSDISEMESDKKAYKESTALFHYLAGVKLGEPINKDSISKYYNFLFNSTALVPNNGRYEGFKSSGKISTIENNELQNDILDLYQENITNLLTTTSYYNTRKGLLLNLFYENVKRTPDGKSNLLEILGSEKAHNVCLILADTNELLSRYNTVINKSKKIIAAIDHEYK